MPNEIKKANLKMINNEKIHNYFWNYAFASEFICTMAGRIKKR